MKRLTALQQTLRFKRHLACLRIRLRAADEGQSMVEFALVLPLLLVVLTGIFSFGMILSQYEVLTDSVSAGARAFALSRGQTTPALVTTDPCAYAISVLEAGAPNLKSSSLTFAITYTDNSKTPAAVHNYTTSCTERAGSGNMTAFDQVQITATYPATPMVFGWSNHSLTMSATATELVN